MKKMTSPGINRPVSQLASFTLIELLTVMAIIAILASLILYAGNSVMTKASRSRASSEIQAMSTALEGYKTDNGIYPIGTTTAGSSSSLLGPPTVAYSLDPTLSGGNYQISSEALFEALSGITNYATDSLVAGVKTYMTFKLNQIGNSAGPSYIHDPWNNSYGYSTGDNKSPQVQYPYNGTGFFDLWSTGGTKGNTTANPNATNTWLSNWQ